MSLTSVSSSNMLSDASTAEMRFMVSDLTESFQKSAEIFFGEKVNLVEHRLIH